jgi:dipeptidyl aminopeptidase/acylaminoacyl peptidase
MYLHPMKRVSLVMLLVVLAGGVISSEAGDLIISVPDASDFLLMDDSLGTPQFDATGDHVVWTRYRGTQWSLLRANSEDLANPTELLSANWSDTAFSYSRTAGMDTNGVLLQRPEGYQLQILRGEKPVTIPISLTGDLKLRGINDGGEAVILASHGFRHAYYRLEANRQLHKILDDPDLADVGFDDHFTPIINISKTPRATAVLNALVNGRWQEIHELPVTELLSTHEFRFDAAGNAVYANLRLDGGTARVVRIALADGKLETVAQDADYDIESFRLDVATGKLDYYATGDPDPGHPSMYFVNAGDNERLRYLDSILPGRILDVGRAPKKDIWLVLLASDQEPGTAVLFDWRTKSIIGSLHLRGSKMSDGDRDRLARTQLVRIPTRDGFRLDAFLTMPRGADAIPAAPRRPVPLVMYLHGGPPVEADGRYDGIAQLLANRGYAVLQVNYRGSSGRGLAFEASAGQVLAGTAIDDVIDSLNWAIAEGYAAPGRVALLGGSFGGYLATSVAIREPRKTACVVSWAGSYDLLALAEQDQQSAKDPLLPIVSAYRFGNADSSTDRSKLSAISPATWANQMAAPTLMVFGARDDRVPPRLAMHFARELQSSGNKPITVSFGNAGHTGWRNEDITVILNLSENFLSSCLGGIARNLDKKLIAKSSMRVLSDSGMIPGLKAAVPKGRYTATLLEGASLQ